MDIPAPRCGRGRGFFGVNLVQHKKVSEHYIRDLFDKGAPFYDCANTVLSLGIDDLWRRELARSIKKTGPGVVADIATGTAKVAVSIAQENPRLTVVGIDFSSRMVEKGAQRVRRKRLGERISLVVGDGCTLPLPRESVDTITIAFGIRNIPARQTALKEFCEVLKPGGQLIVLEFGFPRNSIVRWFYSFYFNHILPRMGNRLIRVDEAFSYLRNSVYNFPAPESFITLLRAAGFSTAHVRPMTAGIVNLFVAEKQ